MRLPYLKHQENKQVTQTVEFRGLNYGPVIEDGEMSDCLNMSSDLYPCLSPRLPRKVEKPGLTNPTALMAKDKLIYVDGEGFYYDSVQKGVVTPGKKQMVCIGDRVIIFPDKTYYDISDELYGTLGETYKQAELVFTTTTITTTGADFAFKAGDGVKLSGCTVAQGNNKTVIVKSVSSKVLTFDTATFTAATETAEVTIAREVPDMDFICEYQNRLWGCKGSEIYASKLGDPFNFNAFKGITSDSYAATVGTDGSFTAIKGFTSHIAFFKPNCIHRLYGNKPANFQFNDSQGLGVAKGCEKSVANVADTLFYVSSNGIMAYTGTAPDNISAKFGTKKFVEAVGGYDGDKYYLSAKDSFGDWSLFVYDTASGIWLREDDTHVLDFSFYDGKLYFLSSDKKIYSVNDYDSKEAVPWSVTFGEKAFGADEKKSHTNFNLQLELCDPDSTISIYINQDRKGWLQIYSGSWFGERKTVSVPIVPTKCDILNIRIEGKGRCKIYALTKILVLGGE